MGPLTKQLLLLSEHMFALRFRQNLADWMRGLGDFQRLQMRDTDPRLAELFGHLRRALDTFEQITLRPHQPRVEPRTELVQEEAPPSRSVTVAPDQEKLAYTVKEIRTLVGISTGTIYRVLGSGELKAVKLGNRTLVLAKDLRDWLNKLPSAR